MRHHIDYANDLSKSAPERSVTTGPLGKSSDDRLRGPPVVLPAYHGKSSYQREPDFMVTESLGRSASLMQVNFKLLGSKFGGAADSLS